MKMIKNKKILLYIIKDAEIFEMFSSYAKFAVFVLYPYRCIRARVCKCAVRRYGKKYNGLGESVYVVRVL